MNPEAPDPMITVIVGVMNNVLTIEQCILSVVEQTYPHKELIIMDAGSRDGTVEILRKYDSAITYWESKPDKGLAHAWNKAMGHAGGDWILVLGSDDFLWKNNVLEKMAPVLKANTGRYGIIYGQVAFLDGRDQVHAYSGQPWDQIRTASRLLNSDLISHQGIFAHISVFERNGLFDESFTEGLDHEWLIRELKDHPALFIPGLVVAAQRHGGTSTRIENRFKYLKAVCRANRQHRVRTFDLQFSIFCLKSLVRYAIYRLFGEQTATLAANTYRKLCGKSVIHTK